MLEVECSHAEGHEKQDSFWLVRVQVAREERQLDNTLLFHSSVKEWRRWVQRRNSIILPVTSILLKTQVFIFVFFILPKGVFAVIEASK